MEIIYFYQNFMLLIRAKISIKGVCTLHNLMMQVWKETTMNIRYVGIVIVYALSLINDVNVETALNAM